MTSRAEVSPDEINRELLEKLESVQMGENEHLSTRVRPDLIPCELFAL
jgi:hypothetical protein